MRRTQVNLLLAAVVVAAATLLSLGLLGVGGGAAGEGQRDSDAVGRFSLVNLIGAILLQDILLAAGLCVLGWRFVFRPLKEIEQSAGVGSDRAGSPAGSMIRRLRARVTALREERATLSTVLDAVPFLVWWKDREGIYLGCNRAFVDAAGCRRAEDVVGKTDADLRWPAQDVETYRANDREILATNRAQRHIVEPFTDVQDGTRRWVDTTKVPLADENGTPYAVLGAAEDVTERMAAEDAIHREKAFMDAILAGLPGVVFLHDEQGRLIKWNARAREVYGYSDEELTGKHFLDWMPEDQKEQTLAAVGEVMRHGHVEMEADVLLKNGARVPHYMTGIRLMIDGKAYMIVVGIDMSERKRVEAALRRERALTDAIFASMPGLLYVYDDQGRMIRWNVKGGETLGLRDRDMSQWRFGEGVAPEDRERVTEAARKVMRDGVEGVVEANLITTRGTVPFYCNGVRVMIDGKPHLLGVGVDISERKRAEETLRREKAFSDAVLDNVPAVLCLFDEHQRPVRWNKRSRELSGYSDEEFALAQKVLWDTPEAKAKITAAIDATLREGRGAIEEDLVTKSGRRIPFYYTGVRLMLDGKPHVLAIGVDMSETKRAEEHLRRALDQAEEASRAKDQFLAAASHELRTPLTPVLLLTSALEADPYLPGDVRQDLGVIREHVEVEKRLIGDLLDFTAIRAGKLHMRPAPTDVHDVIRAALRTCESEIGRKDLLLDMRFDAQRHQTLGDPDRLRQVFWNLLQNACKFSPEHSTVTVRTGDDDDGHTLRVEVADTGRGMDAETLQRVFRAFEQGPRDEHMQHYGGLGLGLPIAKALVEAHGGSISATSAGPNRGSTFIVRLPVTASPATPPPPLPSTTHRFGPARLKLLLVEDHPLTLKTLWRLLTAEGHQVTTATTVGEALQAAAAARFDLVLSDLGLPDGSGLDLMPTLRERYGLPGIALSGFGADVDLEASQKAGFVAHLTKPVTIEALRDHIGRFSAPGLAGSPTGGGAG